MKTVISMTEATAAGADARLLQRSIWEQIERELDALKESESAAWAHLRATLGAAADFSSALAAMLSCQLFDGTPNGHLMAQLLQRVLHGSPWICRSTITR